MKSIRNSACLFALQVVFEKYFTIYWHNYAFKFKNKFNSRWFSFHDWSQHSEGNVGGVGQQNAM